MTDLRSIVEATLVPHKAFEEAKHRVNQALEHASIEPFGIAIIGPSRAGKSRTIEEITRERNAKRGPSGLDVPVLLVTTPAKPTVKGLVEEMLRAMGDPAPAKGTEQTRTARLRKLIKGANTRMIVIDEFQHFYDKGTRKVMYHAADWLKNLIGDCHVSLVVAGLPTCETVLRSNEQMMGRLSAPVIMPRFDWLNNEHRDEFTQILGAFFVSLSEHFDLPELDGPEMAFRCYCGTGGLMGYLTKFLRQAVWNALDSSTRRITVADLAKAHSEAVWASAGISAIPSPLTKEFAAFPTDDVLERVKCLGQPVEPIEQRPTRRSRDCEPTASEVLRR